MGVLAEQPITFYTTTSIGADPESYWGYRVIEVEDNVITRTDFGESSATIDSVPVGNFWLEKRAGNDGASGHVGMWLVNGLPRGSGGDRALFRSAGRERIRGVLRR